MAILAVDGTDIQIATNPDDKTSYHLGTNGQKPYNLLHLNALYRKKQKPEIAGLIPLSLL